MLCFGWQLSLGKGFTWFSVSVFEDLFNDITISDFVVESRKLKRETNTQIKCNGKIRTTSGFLC